jgi:hypothetical protein
MRRNRPLRSLLWLVPILVGLLARSGLAWNHPDPPQYPEVAMDMVGDLDRQLVPRLGMYTANNSRGLYWVVITTPADLGDLERASPLARLFGQELASAFVALGYNVQEVRKASDIIVNRSQGEFALTRDSRALARRSATATLVVAGTYTATLSGIRFCIETLDARNNNVVAMSCRSLPLDATVGALARNDGAMSTPTVSTTNPAQFRREMEPYMTRHW